MSFYVYNWVLKAKQNQIYVKQGKKLEKPHKNNKPVKVSAFLARIKDKVETAMDHRSTKEEGEYLNLSAQKGQSQQLQYNTL